MDIGGLGADGHVHGADQYADVDTNPDGDQHPDPDEYPNADEYADRYTDPNQYGGSQ